MESAICDLCGADDPRALLKRRDRYTGEIFDYVRCGSCGLVYLNPRPRADEMLAYYPNEYEAYQGLASLKPITRFRKRHANRILRHYVEQHGKVGNLLDVGCATGEFMVEMRSHGWRVQGVELSPQSASIARDTYGLDVMVGSIADYHTSGKFHVITLWDVLEHMYSPRSTLESLLGLLASGGHVVFSIPNLRSFDRRLFGDDWIGWDAPRHTFLYDRPLLTRLLAELGLEVVAQDCILGGPGAFRLSWRFWLAERMGRQFDGTSLLRFVDGTIPVVLWPYKSLSYWAKRGPIITYVVRRSGDRP